MVADPLNSGHDDRTGVSPTAIRLGCLIFDVADLRKGGIDPRSYDSTLERLAWQAFTDEINDAGGICGRAIEPVFRTFGVHDGDSIGAADELIHAERVFAVLNWAFLGGSTIVHITESLGTPLLKGDPECDAAVVRRAGGLLSTTLASYRRQMLNLAWGLVEDGHVGGRRIGIVGLTDTTWADDVVEGLDAEGIAPHVVASVARGVATEALRDHAQTMRSLDVDLVVLATASDVARRFVVAADDVGLRALYAVADTGGLTTDVVTCSMPPGFDGAIGFTTKRSGEWRSEPWIEPDVDRSCREVFERRAGVRIAPEHDELRYSVMMIASVVHRFAAAASVAGDDLTRASLQGGIESLGRVSDPFTGGGSFGPGKLDGSDCFRFVRWSSDRGWCPAGPFVPGKY